MQITVRYDEGSKAFQPNLLWDTVPVYVDPLNFYLDYALAGPSEPGNQMGMSATRTIATAVALCLFTNARATNPNDSNDPQGWWGDEIQLDEHDLPLGSLLWTLMRSPLNQTVANQAVLYAQQALQTLIAQGVCASITVDAEMQQVNSILALTINLYSQTGANAYNQTFAIYWNQITGA